MGEKIEDTNVEFLSDPLVLVIFSEIIYDKILCGETEDSLAGKAGVDIKTIQRYINNELPKSIKNSTYKKILKALDLTHSEFKNHVKTKKAYLNHPDLESLSESEDLLESEGLQEPELMSEKNAQKIDFISRHFRFTNQFKYFNFNILILVLILFILFLLVWLNQENKQFKIGTVKYYKNEIAKNTNNFAAYYDLANVYANQTNNDEAIRYYRLAIEKEPEGHPTAYNNLSLLLISQNKNNDALVLLDSAMKNVVTDNPQEQWAQKGIILKNRAWVYLNNGQKPKALELIIKAQQLLGPAQILNEFPEVFCINALVTTDSKKQLIAENECIKRITNQQIKQQNNNVKNPNRIIHGLIYELYKRVLSQQEKEI